LGISAEERMREAVLAADARIRCFIDSNIVGVLIATPDGQILEANDYYLNLIGYTRAELSDGKVNWRALTPAEWLPADEKAIRELRERGTCAPYEKEYVRRDGTRVTVFLADAMLPGAEERIAAFALDLTQRKQAEIDLTRVNRALRATTACSQAIVHATDEGALLRDVSGAIVDAGGYRMAWVGFAENDEARTVRPVAIAGGDQGYVAAARFSWAEDEHGRGPTGRAIRAGEPMICQNILSDQTFTPWREAARARGFASSIVLPLRHEGRTIGALSIYAGEPAAFDRNEAKWLIGLGEDISFGITALREREDRKRAEEALARSEHSLAEAQRLAHLGSWDLDLLTNEVRWSDETFRIYGWPRREGRFPLALSLAMNLVEDQPAVDEAFRAALAGVKPFAVEHRIRRQDGTMRWLRCCAEVVRADSGEPKRVVGTVLDITEEKQAEVVLRQHNLELQRFNDLAVGRELRMVELKREVNRLAQELGRPAPYELPAEEARESASSEPPLSSAQSPL
jgi:PAS domain S-box-containing protein